MGKVLMKLKKYVYLVIHVNWWLINPFSEKPLEKTYMNEIEGNGYVHP